MANGDGSDSSSACSDEFAAVAASTAAPSEAPKRHRVSKKQAASSAFGHKASSRGASPEAGSVARCHLCESSDGLLTESFRGHMVHKPCKNAIRAHQRLLSNDEKHRIDTMFMKNIVAWRQRVMPLVTAPGQRRTTAQRETVKAASELQFKTVARIKTKHRFTKNHYISYRCFWDRMTVPQASAALEEAISDAGTDLTNSDGEPTVMVVGNELERTTIGTRTGTTTTTAEDNATTKADSVGKLIGRKRARASDAGGDDDDDDDDNAMTTPNPKRKGDPSQRLTAAALSKLGAQKGPASASLVSESPQIMQLRSRAALQAAAKRSLDEVTGAKAPFVLLTKRFASADKDQVALLDTDPQATLNLVKAEVVDPLRELQREVEKLHVGQVGAKQVFLWTSSFRLSPLHSPTIWFWGTCLGVGLP